MAAKSLVISLELFRLRAPSYFIEGLFKGSLIFYYWSYRGATYAVR